MHLMLYTMFVRWMTFFTKSTSFHFTLWIIHSNQRQLCAAILAELKHVSWNFPTSTTHFLGRQCGEYFGSSLAAVDVNGDGVDELIIGAPLYSSKPAITSKTQVHAIKTGIWDPRYWTILGFCRSSRRVGYPFRRWFARKTTIFRKSSRFSGMKTPRDSERPSSASETSTATGKARMLDRVRFPGLTFLCV